MMLASKCFSGMSIRKICVTIFFFGFFLIGLFKTARSQYSVTEASNLISSNLLFERFYSRDGLPDDRIRTIFQDSRGFIWLGTMNGLARFDGYNFKKYSKSKDSTSICGNWAYAICEDNNKDIWVGTKQGLSRYDIRTNVFENFLYSKTKNSVIYNLINTLQFDNSGKLWIGTPKGLSVYDVKQRKFKNYKSYPFNLNIRKIIKSFDDYLWIATQDGVVHYNTANGKSKFFKIKVKPNAYGDRFWSLLEVDKNLYITTGREGLLKLPYNRVTKSYGTFEFSNNFTGGSLANTEIFSICKSKTGDVWLGTSDLGLVKIQNINNTNRKITFHQHNSLNDQSISNNQVFEVFIDKTEVLWCGTERGLNKLSLNLLPFQYYTFTNKSLKDNVRSLYTEDGKSIWLGTSKMGLFNYNLLSGATKYFRFSNSFQNANRSLLVDDNQVWNGSLEGALQLNKQGGSSTKAIDGHAVFAILKDTKGNKWFGTNNGLYKITISGSIINYLPSATEKGSISSEFVRAIYEDHKGNIWIGYENGSIDYYNPKKDAFVALPAAENGEKIIGNTIFSIIEYPKNTIWAGSESGLNRLVFNKDGSYHIKSYSEDDGLPDKSVNGILADNKGNLWISTIKGLIKFNIQKEHFQTYLNNISFSFSSCFKYSDNCFLFGGSDGFVVFNPNLISSNKTAPQVVFSDFKLFNKSVNINEEINGDVILKESISNTKEITLDYYNNQFTIEFAALHYANPQNNNYAYKLEGFNNNWTFVNAANRSATYTNLDAGEYIFTVKASNYSGVWNGTPQTLKITILPPPWKTVWAIIIYIILLNVLLYIFVRYLLIQSKQRQQIHFEQKEKEQLKKLNDMKVKFFTDVSHEFRTPLSLIVGPIEDIVTQNNLTDELKHKANLIYRNSKKLMYLIDELMTFQKLEQGMLKLKLVNADIIAFTQEIYDNFSHLAHKRNIDFRFISSENECTLDFDAEKIEIILNNLLFNAFKFSKQNGHISIIIKTLKAKEIQNLDKTTFTDDWLSIVVEDDGKGISSEEFNHLFERFFSENTVKGTGVGLSLTKSLVELHQGMITASSQPNVSTRFEVYLPVRNQASTENNHILVSDYDIKALAEESIIQDSADKADSIKEYTLLIVDDNPEVLDYLFLTFQDRYEVVKAENGSQALALAQELLPDMIISDVMMPEMDGVEFCKAIKSNINTCHIPLILLTAKSAIEDRITGYETGADDYIPKPFHPNILKTRVDNLIEAQRRIVEKFQTDGGVVVPKNVVKNPLDEKFLNKVIESIKANMSNEDLSVEELGSMVAMSRSNLFRKLKAITGQTPIEFIYYIRLKYAMELLLERKLSISEIAYEVGFKNPSSFTKSFKKQFGKSPREFLNNVIENRQKS